MQTKEYWLEQYSQAINIASFIHRKQFRRDNTESYINHVMRVSRSIQMHTIDYFSNKIRVNEPFPHPEYILDLDSYWVAICAAVLHDVFEDGSMEDLLRYDNKILGVDESIISHAKALNKNQYNTYEEYITAVSESKILSVIKVFDIQDNFSGVSEKKSKIYLKSWNELVRKHNMKKYMGGTIFLQNSLFYTAVPLDLQ